MKKNITNLLFETINELKYEEIEALIEIPPQSKLGDYAFPCFKLSSIYKKSPNIISQEIKEKIQLPDYINRIEQVGAYINFFIDRKYYAKHVFNVFFNTKYNNINQVGSGKTIVIDYSSPNIAKKFHIGHLRTTIIGNSLYRMFKFCGYNCIGINHLGDWGTQFGKLIVAYKKWGSKKNIEEKGIDELGKLYIKFHDEAEKEPKLNEEARAWFKLMEQGNDEALKLWKWFKDISIIEFEKIYKLLNIKFDFYAGESFYNDKTQGVVNELKQKKLIKESEGAKIVDLSTYELPPCLITKNDGSTLYATRDLAAAIYRKNTYNFEKCIYVTGLEQKLHFSQLFKVIELMGYNWSNNLIHVPYGMVSMDKGKLSTRKGNIILVEDLLNQAIEKTKDIISEKNPNLEDKEDIAKSIGIGAIIFNDLYNSRIKDVTFSWNKVLNFYGETGPYVQYSHTRASSILKKSDFNIINDNISFEVLDDEPTYYLLKHIDLFSETVLESIDKMEPYIVARYVVNLSRKFNKFYDECPILVEDNKIRNARLNVVYMVKETIKNALYLLGIESPDQM